MTTLLRCDRDGCETVTPNPGRMPPGWAAYWGDKTPKEPECMRHLCPEHSGKAEIKKGKRHGR